MNDGELWKPTGEALRERFWKDVPVSVPGARLSRVDTHVVAQTGPGGHRTFDTLDLQVGDRSLRLIATYKPKLLAGEALNLRRRLLSIEESLRLRRPALESAAPALITDAAAPSTIDACIRSGTALFDLRGTVIVRVGEVFIHVLGERAKLPPARGSPFSGKATRVIRRLLNAPDRRPSIRRLAEEVQAAYSYVHGIVESLQAEGFIEYRGRSGGLILRDPRGLLVAWRDRGEKTAFTTESFNARATHRDALAQGARALESRGARFVFTLASGVAEADRVVTALPHGLYCSAGLDVIAEAFSLRRQTPANFTVLRPRPASDSEAGGVFDSPRSLPWGEAVSLPQLVVDLAQSGGRGREQSDALLEQWVRSLPLLEDS